MAAEDDRKARIVILRGLFFGIWAGAALAFKSLGYPWYVDWLFLSLVLLLLVWVYSRIKRRLSPKR